MYIYWRFYFLVSIFGILLFTACGPATPPATPILVMPTALVTAVSLATPLPGITATPMAMPSGEPTEVGTTHNTATPLPLATAVPPLNAPDTAVYQVAYVQKNDQLNVRSGPGVEYDIIGTLAATAGNVRITGSGQEVVGSTWVPITNGALNGWVNGRFLTTQLSGDTFCQSPAAQALLTQLETAVRQRDDATLATLIHPERGLRIRYSWWNPELLWRGAEAQTLLRSPATLDWGVQDGSGNPIVGTVNNVILPLLDRDLLSATQLACDSILHGPTTGLVQLPDGYGTVHYFSRYRPATDASGFDWGTWVIGVEQWHGIYYLSYLVHFAWEI